MNKLVSNKTILSVFIGLTLFFIVGSLVLMIIVSLNYRVSMIESPFIFGIVSAIVVLLYVSATIHSYQTNRLKNVIHFKKYKWIIWIVSVCSIVLLVLSCYQVFYNLHNTMFPQAVGLDQGAYWSANAPFIYLSGFAIILIILANLILLFIPSENQ
jgi:hypothetical protein